MTEFPSPCLGRRMGFSTMAVCHGTRAGLFQSQQFPRLDLVMDASSSCHQNLMRDTDDRDGALGRDFLATGCHTANKQEVPTGELHPSFLRSLDDHNPLN